MGRWRGARGGAGKTRVGLRVAAEALAAFPDGVYFVPLAPIADPALVAAAIAARVGIRDAGDGGIPVCGGANKD